MKRWGWYLSCGACCMLGVVACGEDRVIIFNDAGLGGTGAGGSGGTSALGGTGGSGGTGNGGTAGVPGVGGTTGIGGSAGAAGTTGLPDAGPLDASLPDGGDAG